MRFTQDFRAEYLLVIAFFATIPLYSPNMVLFHDGLPFASALMPTFVNALMASAVLAGVVTAWMSARTDGGPLLRGPWAVAGALLYVGGFCLMVAAFGGLGEGVAGHVAAILAGIMLAVATVELAVCWGAMLVGLDLRHALGWVAVMMGCASLLQLLLASVQVGVGLAVFGLLAVLAAGLPAFKALRGQMPSFACGEREAALVPQDSDMYGSLGGPTSFLATVRQMAQVLIVPFVGLLMFAFMMGVRKFFVFEVVSAEVLGVVVGAMLVGPLCALRRVRPLLPFIYQVLVPAFVLVLIVCNSFMAGTVPMFVAAYASYVFYGAMGILALASLCAMAHAREFPVALIYSLTVACFAAASGLGVFCGSLPLFEAENGGPVLLVISTCYFAFLLAVPLFGAWWRERSGAFALAEDDVAVGDGAASGDVAGHGRRKGPFGGRAGESCSLVGAAGSGQASAEAGRLDVEGRCEKTAEKFGLSPRETEILGYLGRGHGIVFIANTLVISESTVRTHVKNIYRKLGVNSREELLQLVDRA